MRAGPGARATACSPRARSGRCTTSPTSWAASCWSWAPEGPAGTTSSAPCLTRREREVLAELCAGQTNAAIAAKLSISAKTVDHHVSAVLAKLGAPNRNAAAARADQLGLLS